MTVSVTEYAIMYNITISAAVIFDFPDFNTNKSYLQVTGCLVNAVTQYDTISTVNKIYKSDRQWEI